MRRRVWLGAAFVALVLAAAWSQQQPEPYEHTFEASRLGVTAVDAPGPFTHPDFVRLLVRRAGAFRMEAVRDLREWRTAAPVSLWDIALPETLKLRVEGERLEVAAQPASLRLGVEALYNLPVLVRNDGKEAVDVKLIARIGEDGPADRFTARPGINYFSLNLRPRAQGRFECRVKLYAGLKLAEGASSPPESTVAREIAFPVEVVGWGTLRVRTTQPARVYVVGSDGLSYTPARRMARITWSSGEYFYYSRGGEDEIRVPAGTASVEAVRGIEWEPRREQADVREGTGALVSLALTRRENLPQQGWYSGDVHIHANYNNHEFITPEDVRDQVEAEDLHVANLMVANSTGPHIHDEQYFEGRPHRLSTASHLLYWVEEMRNAGLYGHLCLVGLKALVKPLHTGFANSAWPYDYPPNHAQAEAARRQGGAATYAHPGYSFTADPQTMSARELPVDLALGSIDAMDVMSNAEEDAATAMWYRLLNTGLRCAISAGTDSFTNRRQHWVPGGERVYVQAPGPLDYGRWVAGLKAGRSFATNGPIVRFTVEGKGPGEELRLPAPGAVNAVAAVSSVVPFETVELVANGRVVASARAEDGGRSARLQAAHRLEASAWLAVRVRGPYHRLLTNDRFAYAHTSPVYALVGNGKIGAREDAEFFIGWIDRLIAMAESRGRYASEQQKREVIALFRQAQDYYRSVAR